MPLHVRYIDGAKQWPDITRERNRVRRPQVRELGEQIAVGPYFILRDLPIREDSQEGILDVVGECPAIARKGRRTRGVIAQEIWQQCPCNLPCLLRRIPARVLQRVREASGNGGNDITL